MAIKYWENLLNDVKSDIKNETFRQATMQQQVHSCKLDKSWTKAGIERGVAEVNKSLAKRGEPLLDLSKNRITRAANIFHKECAKARGKRITPIAPDRFGNFQYPKRKIAEVGSKKSPPGKRHIFPSNRMMFILMFVWTGLYFPLLPAFWFTSRILREL